jgi:hypothetical protein
MSNEDLKKEINQQAITFWPFIPIFEITIIFTNYISLSFDLI